jgi:hypothetical protein
MLGNMPPTLGRAISLGCILVLCVAGAVMTLAGDNTGSGFETGAGYLAFPGIVLFGLLLRREVRRLR